MTTKTVLSCGSLLFFLLLGGCSGGGGDFTCTTDRPPTISSSPSTAATASYQYTYYVNAAFTCVPFVCNSIDGIILPQGASIDDFYDSISWTPGPELIGQSLQFRIATEPDSCGESATQTWSVTIHAPPAIASFSADRTAVSPGESVNLTAIFSGTGTIAGIGPVKSGVPVATPALETDTTFILSVANSAGTVTQQSLTIEVPATPVVEGFTATPAIVTIGYATLLEWRGSGDYSVATIDPGNIDVLGASAKSVSPSATTTYTLRLANNAGISTTASVTVVAVPAPIITSFTATQASTVFQGSVSLGGTFSNGGGLLERNDPAIGFVPVATIASGETVDSGALQRSTEFRLVVTNAAGTAATQNLLVPIVGPGTFQLAANQPIYPSRSSHSATKLRDGSVFIAGGLIDGASSVSTERFDPVNEIFTAGPDLLEGRHNQAASLLPDGRVLLVGGYRSDATRILNAEIFDPAANTIVSAGELPVVDLVAPKSVTLADGMVLIVHGSLGQGSEIFDQATGLFSSVGPLQTIHACIELASLFDANNRILVIDGSPSRSSEIFSPAAGSFTLTGPVAHNRCYFASATMQDGSVLITGGAGEAPAEIYDPQTGSYRNSGSTNHVSSQPVAVTLDNGQVLVVGGLTGGWDSPWAELFDPGSEQFVLTGGMLKGHRVHSATRLDDGRVLVVGGCYAPCPAELYTP